MSTRITIELPAEKAALLNDAIVRKDRRVFEFLENFALENSLHQLPPAPLVLIGRDEELNDLERRAATSQASVFPIVTKGVVFQGLGGVGKTALGLSLAHRLKKYFPDAQLFLNLRSLQAIHGAPIAPHAAMQNVIQSLKPDHKMSDDPEILSADYHAVLADAGRVLLFLDDVENTTAIQPLLPPANCLLLVTSRNELNVPGLILCNLDHLKPSKSRELLLNLAPRIQGYEEVAAELCGNMPLTLEVFAGAINGNKHLRVPELLQHLRKQTNKLGHVGAVLELSDEMLPKELRERWVLLSVFPADFELRAAAAVWRGASTGMPGIMGGWETANVEAARETMKSLVNANLVEYRENSQRFLSHELVRRYCNTKLNQTERNYAQLSYADHYCEITKEAEGLYLTGGKSLLQGLELFDRERVHIETAFAIVERLSFGSDGGGIHIAVSRLLVSLVNAVAHIGDLRFHPNQRIRWLEAQRKAAHLIRDRKAEGIAIGNLGLVYNYLGDTLKAISFLENSLEICREIGDRRGEGRALGNLGSARYSLGDARKAIECHERALKILSDLGDKRAECTVLGNLGKAHFSLGHVPKAIGFYEKELSLSRELGDKRGEGAALGNLGLVYNDLNDPLKAIAFYQQRLGIAREIGDRRGEGSALFNLGRAHFSLNSPNDVRKTIGFYEQALLIDREIGDRRREEADFSNLGIAYKSLGDPRKAIEFYTKALAISREIGDRLREGNALWNYALALDVSGDREQAINCAKAALQIREAIHDPNAEKVRRQIADWRRREIADKFGEEARKQNLAAETIGFMIEHEGWQTLKDES